MFHFYGLIIGIAIIASFILFRHLVSRDPVLSKINPSIWQSAFVVILICGLIGARLYHILDFYPLYRQQPIEIIKLWNGGLGIFGAIILGSGGLIIFLSCQKLPILKTLDVLAPCLVLGQAIGRWANFVNQEIYGWPTNLLWGIYIDKTHRLPGFENYQSFHPLFLYEILGSLVIFVILMIIRKWQSAVKYSLTAKYRLLTTRPSSLRAANCKSLTIDGFTFFLYLILYGTLRFFLEGMRIRGWVIDGVNVAQMVAIIFVVFGIGGMIYQISTKLQITNNKQIPNSKLQ